MDFSDLGVEKKKGECLGSLAGVQYFQQFPATL